MQMCAHTVCVCIGDADRAASGAAASTSAGGGDWRLRAPERTVEYHQREGAHTWDTEDYTTKAGQALRKKEVRTRAQTRTHICIGAPSHTHARTHAVHAYYSVV